MVVLKLNRRSSLGIVCVALFVWRSDLVLRRISGWYGWVVRCNVVASLSLLLCAAVFDYRVDEETDKSKARECQYTIDARYLAEPYKTKMLNPTPVALVPLITATKSIIKTPPKKPVWKQFMVRNVPGFKASRKKSTMARASISKQMMMNNIKTTILLYVIST